MDLKPKIIKQLRDSYNSVNEDVEFYCEYFSKSKVIDVSWYYNGSLIIKQAFQRKYEIKIEEGRSRLHVIRANIEDVGIYEIKITNEFGSTSSRAFLSIKKGN